MTDKTNKKRPYQPPAITEEQAFEKQALQACDKTPADGAACDRVFPPPAKTPNVS